MIFDDDDGGGGGLAVDVRGWSDDDGDSWSCSC